MDGQATEKDTECEYKEYNRPLTEQFLNGWMMRT